MSSLPNSMYDYRPQREETKQAGTCSNCGWGIYVGDDYWIIDGKKYCLDCINQSKKVGGEE